MLAAARLFMVFTIDCISLTVSIVCFIVSSVDMICLLFFIQVILQAGYDGLDLLLGKFDPAIYPGTDIG